jgi:hypothetical protein
MSQSAERKPLPQTGVPVQAGHAECRRDQPACAEPHAVLWSSPALQAARSRLLNAARGNDPIEIERAARSLRAAATTAVLRQSLAASVASISALVRRLSGHAPVAPRTEQQS